MTPLYVLLWLGSCLLSGVAGAYIHGALHRPLPRNAILEPIYVDSEAQIVVRYRKAGAF